MASYSSSLSCAVAALLLVLSLQYVQGEFNLQCSMLPVSSCAFAVDSAGARCLLETSTVDDLPIYSCQTSQIIAGVTAAYIENEQCLESCGVDRMTVGVSTDGFFNPDFVQKLCSIECQQCSNIVDLYSNVVSAIAGGSFDRFCNHVQSTSGLLRDLRMRGLLVNSIAPSSYSIAPTSGITYSAQPPTLSGF